jgi:signal peptidase II
MRALPWVTALHIIAHDRITKKLVQAHVEQGALVPVFPGFAVSHVHNRGIAFSLFADGGLLSRVILHFVIVGAVVVISWMLVRHGKRGCIAGLGFGLILGGAVGNLIDRIAYGWVVDFLHCWIRLGGRYYSWPDFNVADSAITVGAILLVVYEFRGQRAVQKHAEEAESAPRAD